MRFRDCFLFYIFYIYRDCEEERSVRPPVRNTFCCHIDWLNSLESETWKCKCMSLLVSIKYFTEGWTWGMRLTFSIPSIPFSRPFIPGSRPLSTPSTLLRSYSTKYVVEYSSYFGAYNPWIVFHFLAHLARPFLS